MRRIAAALAALLILAALTVPVFAADVDYVGQIDPETGEPVSSGTSAENPSLTRVLVSRDVLYDRSSHLFVFQLGTGINEVYSSAADGMIVNTPVSITSSEGIPPGFPQRRIGLRRGPDPSEYPGQLCGVGERGQSHGTGAELYHYLTFVTGEAEAAAGGGTDGPIRLTLGYYDHFGDLRTLAVDDLRQYLIDGETEFTSGSTRTALLLVDDVVQVRWIQVEPWHEKGTDAASWTLVTVSAEATGLKADRAVNSTIWEGSPPPTPPAPRRNTGSPSRWRRRRLSRR